MSDIRQSPQYANYIKSIGWQVDKIGKWNAFIKKFPLIGSLIKIQRIEPPIPYAGIETLSRKHRAFQIVLEPSDINVIASEVTAIRRDPAEAGQSRSTIGFRPLKSPFIPTKTLVLDLEQTEQAIFDSFSKNKRRDIRLAEKNNLIVKEGSPQAFYELKKKFLLRKRILPFGTKNEIFPLCQAFGKNAQILLACLAEVPMAIGTKAGLPCPSGSSCSSTPLAGLLLLFSGKTAYYWQAASTLEGNKLLAPTLLLWEAIKLAKKKGCLKFDFEGVYDERFPQNKSWLGFTHFKQGFGGKEIEFPLPLSNFRFSGL